MEVHNNPPKALSDSNTVLDLKYLKVVLSGTQIVIELFRKDLNTQYTGHTAGLEFEWQPKN